MALSINDLGVVLEEVYDTRTKWYDVGLMLRVPVQELDSIQHRLGDPHDKLREALKAWLKTAVKPTWQSIVDILKSRVVGEPHLAYTIERRFSHTAETGQTYKEVEPKEAKSQFALQLPMTQEKSIPVLTWNISEEAPVALSRGSAVSDGKIAYFNGGGSTTVYQYDSESQQWFELPNCPTFYSCLAVVQGMLTTVGGTLGVEYTNSLLSLTGEGKGKRWCPYFPPMMTGRRYPAAICSGQALIVAGGSCGYNELATVEVLDTDTMQWSTTDPLPCPLTFATAAVCGDRLYLMGGNDDYLGMTRIVFTSSIPELLKSHLIWPAAHAKQAIWRCIADVPLYHSTCANLGGQLVAVGGRTEAHECATAVFVYDEVTNSWRAQQDMPTARENALVAVFPGNIMVVGGFGAQGLLSKVDIATFL